LSVKLENPPTAPAPLAARYSNVAAIDLGPVIMLVLAGQVALDKDGSIVGADMATQTEQIFECVGGLLSAYDADLTHVVNIRTYLANMDLLAEYGAVRRKYLTAPLPTSTTVEVSRLFMPDALLEIDITAVVPKS
jgi:enamine deaminase RidA (YjgF/YER057c/UK114 family)